MASKKVNVQALTGISNIEFWNEARKNSPKFASYTSEGTKETFTEKGFEALQASDLNVLNQFFELSLRVAFQKLDVARARNGFENSGLMEVYDTPNGGFVQRIAVQSIKPISPKYNGLAEGSSVDPFTVRKPKSSQRFFTQNYNYQNLISIQDFQVKQIFLDEYGMGQYIAGVLAGLDSGRIAQEVVNVKEVINAGLNSTAYPLKDTQKIATSLPADISTVTDAQLLAFIQSVLDLDTAMQAADVPFTGMYNAAGFETHVDSDQYVLLVRSGIKNRIKTMLTVGAYNPDDLTLPWNIIEVNDFGGLYPYAEDSYTTRLYTIADTLGSQTGYYISEENATAAGASLVKNEDSDGNTLGYQLAAVGVAASSIAGAVAADAVYWKDENAEVVAMVAQRGLIFENRQNPYSVQPIYNPAGMYTNYWANSPNNGINYDYYYNCVIFTRATE